MASALASLGKGAYTAADTSRILRIPYSKAKYWFRDYARNKFFDLSTGYHFRINELQAISFLTLIEMSVFYTLKEKKVSTWKILEAHRVMSAYLQTPYPFARQDIFVDKKSLLFGDDDIELLTADKRLQSVIVSVLKPFISKVQFNDDRLAHKFYPLGKNKAVVVNPKNQFGQPIIEGTNILTQTIKSFSLGGESNASIAKLFNIDVKQVHDAIEFATAA